MGELYQQNIYQCSLILRKKKHVTDKCSLVLSEVVINQGALQSSCYIGKHWTKVHPGKWPHEGLGVRCAGCNECKRIKCVPG